MPDREIAPTRIALLELLDERRLVREGYELLDERRMLLAARILRGLDELERRRAGLVSAWQSLMLRLAEALRAHGLNELEAWPPHALDLTLVRCVESALGIDVGSATATVAIGPPSWPPAAAAPTIDACIEAARQLLADAVPIAALETSLLRLMDEYRRTERRTRAIENVLLPELNTDLANVEAALESLDQEEVVRVHSLRSHA
jgi:V/A-type H+-transporting ATPase subunit D